MITKKKTGLKGKRYLQNNILSTKTIRKVIKKKLWLKVKIFKKFFYVTNKLSSLKT